MGAPKQTGNRRRLQDAAGNPKNGVCSLRPGCNDSRMPTLSVSTASSPWRRLARRRELWWQFTVRAIEMRHRGSHLGVVWALLNPLMMLALYGVVFGVFLENRFHVLPDETGIDFALGVFLGLILFHLVAETIAAAPSIITSNPNLVKKVVFPVEVLPLSQLGAFCFHAGVSLLLLLVGIAVLGRGLTLEGVLWLPIIILPLVMLAAGLSLLLSTLGVFFRDISQVTGFLTQITLYASAVFYATSKITPTLWAVLQWNPLLHTIHLCRDALLWQQPINVGWLGYTYVAGSAALATGWFCFRKSQPAFADVI